MKLADFAKLKKLMALTFSNNDPEALAALRAANAILTKESLSWDRVLDRVVTIVNEVEDAPLPRVVTPASDRGAVERHPACREIDDWFKVLSREELGGFEQFVNSVEAQYRQKGYLSASQYDSIKRAVDRAENPERHRHRDTHYR